MDINIGKYFLFVLVIIFKFEYGLSAVYYSGTRNDTFHDSKQYCQSVGGSLLTYGKLMISAVRTCEKPSEDPSLWTAPPWYNLDLRCFNATASEILEGTDEDKHLAVCADFCTKSMYGRFGLWTTKCECYDNSVNLTGQACSYKQCPLNPGDRCGLLESGVIYTKVQQSGTYCRYRKFKPIVEGGIIENLDLCTAQKPFLCKVGSSDTVHCSLDGLSVEEASSEGLIIGLVVGIGLLLVVVLSIVLVIRFRRNNVDEERETEEQVQDLSKDQGTFHFTSSTRNKSSPFGSHDENHY